MNLNNSPATSGTLPEPLVAMLILPGLALAKAMNSATVFAGTDGLTTMTSGTRRIPAIGVMSRRMLKPRLP
jgi:hypothetical protein